MTPLWIDERITYDGRQLVSHFAYRRYGVMGDVIVGFRGPADVRISEMVDLEDVRQVAPISSDEMLHFLIEMFEVRLGQMVWVQRFFILILFEHLTRYISREKLSRDGDDIFYDGRKLSVSIATVSPLSGLVHTALNIKPTGAPIPISCLEEMGIDPTEFGRTVMEAFCVEVEGMDKARTKVRWVE
ncbi:DUF366 family protein [Thermospira aquatica]|uniref:DUF366 family protein n=1 Tax=Thermospira aquatica TaxID=2828656 RepID=A0AAX3BBB7_9SPIR|nr:DUF366 family protein [Thermospira aquatica]URA09592.1 DUF366 family protein [Thermospira aquatica]